MTQYNVSAYAKKDQHQHYDDPIKWIFNDV